MNYILHCRSLRVLSNIDLNLSFNLLLMFLLRDYSKLNEQIIVAFHNGKK